MSVKPSGQSADTDKSAVVNSSAAAQSTAKVNAAVSADVAVSENTTANIDIAINRGVAVSQNAAVSKNRFNRLVATMQKEKLTAFLARDTSDITWLTAFEGVFDDEQAHALLVSASDYCLHTDSRYASACRAAAQSSPVTVDDRRVSHARWAADYLSHADIRPQTKEHVTFGIDDGITLAEYRALVTAFAGELPNLHIVETHDVIKRLRAVKDAGEVVRLRAAQAITDAAFTHIVSFIKPGMTERAVQLELEDFMRRHGAQDLAFSFIVASGANGANPHATPGEDKLEAGQCVVMDFGARACGYCSDMTRTVFMGEPDAHLVQAYRTLREANEQVEAMLKPGVTGAEAHALAEAVLAAGGYGGKMGHGLGHGVGIDIHEEPVLSPRNTAALETGNVVTVEPGIYLEGDFGMRLEDFGIITEDGFEVFTRSTHEMVII